MILKPAKISPLFNGMRGVLSVKAFPTAVCLLAAGSLSRVNGAANRIRVGQGSVRCWLLALLGPVAVPFVNTGGHVQMLDRPPRSASAIPRGFSAAHDDAAHPDCGMTADRGFLTKGRLASDQQVT